MSDPNQLKLTTGGGGVLTLFGLPFLLVGVGVLLAPAFGVVMHSEGGGPANPAVRWVLGGLFSLVGAAIAFGRCGVILDRSRQELTSWWGVLIPFHRSVRSLSDFNLVAFKHEVRRSSNSNGGGSSTTVYPVVLRATEGEDKELLVPRSRHRARSFAERVAKFLEFGLADATDANEVVRAAGTLDHSLHELLRDDPPAAPEQPRLGEGRYEVEGRTAIVQIPAPGFLRAGGVGALFGLVVPVIFLGVFLGDFGDGSGRYMFYAFAGFVLLCSAVPLLLVASAVTTREQLRISSDGVDVQRMGPLALRKRRHVPMDVLEEVEVQMTGSSRSPFGRRSLVVLQTDEARVTVGLGMDPDGQDWLRQLVRYVAARGEAPQPARV